MENTTTCFSEDVLIQILVCLPVKSLLRFKSVCKSWRTLIDTPFFIDLHTTTTTFKYSSSKFGSFIFYLCSNENFVLSSKSRSSSKSAAVCGDGDEDDHNVDYLGFMPCNHAYAISISSCNGLICIHEKAYDVISLWNPATKQFRTLPHKITIPTEPEWKKLYVFVVLGFDIKTKDYKVVQFRCFEIIRSGLRFCRIQVYSLSTNSWRLLEGIHNLPATPSFCVMHQNQGIYMNGCYFFVGRDDDSQLFLDEGDMGVVCTNSLIYSFDFTKEILTTTIQAPDHDSRHDLILTNLGADKIALFIIQRNYDCGLDYEYYHIWGLNDEQPGSGRDVVINKESWTKLHSFRKLNKLYYASEPRGITNNGEFALISTRRTRGLSELQLFNLVTGEATKDFPFGRNVVRSDVYRESLISIIGGNGAAKTTAKRVVGGAM